MVDILVGYDGSPDAQAAVRWALDEAGRTGAAVCLAHAAGWTKAERLVPGPGPVLKPREETRREADELVRAAVNDATVALPGVPVHGEVLEGGAASSLRERSAAASLLVLGGRGRGGFTGLLLGSTTATLATHAHCPVVVVRGVDPDSGTRPGPVLVGVDGSAHAQSALRFAAEQAATRNVPLRVLRVWELPEPEWRPTHFDVNEFVQMERDALIEWLAGAREEHPDVEMIPDVVIGHPTEALIDASGDAQLAVVGSRGRGGFSALLLGSVSQQLLHHARCPVAVVRGLPTRQTP